MAYRSLSQGDLTPLPFEITPQILPPISTVPDQSIQYVPVTSAELEAQYGTPAEQSYQQAITALTKAGAKPLQLQQVAAVTAGATQDQLQQVAQQIGSAVAPTPSSFNFSTWLSETTGGIKNQYLVAGAGIFGAVALILSMKRRK